MTSDPLTPEQTTALTALAHRFTHTLTADPAADTFAVVTALMDALDTTTASERSATLADIHHGLDLIDAHADHLWQIGPTRAQLNTLEWHRFALTHTHLALCADHHPEPAPTPTTDQALRHVRAHVIDTHPEPAPLAYDAIRATAAALPTLGAHPHFGPDATTLEHVLALTGHALHHAHQRRHRNHRTAYGRAIGTPTLRTRFERRRFLPGPTAEPDTVHRHARALEEHLHTLTQGKG